MNERIKELARQAGNYVNEVYSPPVRSKEPGKIWEDGHVDWMEQFNEKFAELIVNKCANIVWDEAEKTSNSDVNDAGYKIIEYFHGVEERTI